MTRATDDHVIQPGELEWFLDELVSAGAPGAAARVAEEHDVQRAARGLADVRACRPMRAGLCFRAGSATKAFVATVVLQLVAERRLSLTDTLERWLPGIVPRADHVELRQLLGHTSGVPDYVASISRTLHGSEQERLRAWAPRELIALVADQPPRFPPGTAWSYSNTGYILLGLIVEAATGATLGDELNRRIFLPLGLGSTSFPVDSPDIPEPMSRGYGLPVDARGEALDGPLVDFTVLNPSWAWAAGALLSDLHDLTRFFRALLGGQLLPASLLAEMSTPVALPPGAIPLPLYDGYGLGLVTIDTPAGRLIGHPGGIPGYLSTILCTPDGRRQLGLMINVGDLAPAAVNEALVRGTRELGAQLLA